MKKLMCLIVALLVAPAMATITVEIVNNEDFTGTIVVTASDTDADANGSLLAGIAFDASVDGGAIMEGVVAAKTGESTAADPGYGIFMSNILIEEVDPDGTPDSGDEYYDITNPGGCVSAADDPDLPPQLPGAACTLEFGCLYNVNVVADAPLLITTLATVTVDKDTVLTLVLDDARGQAALIGGGAPSEVLFVGGPITGPSDICYEGQPDFAEWDAVGRPLSWCNKYQCLGDVDGLEEVVGWVPVPPPNGTFNYGPVGPTDLGLFLAAYKAELGQPEENLAADLDHAAEVVGWVPVPPPNGTFNYGRTGAIDLGLFLPNYKAETYTLTPCGTPPLE